MKSPKEVIDNIRKFNFGIGLEKDNLSDDAKVFMERQKTSAADYCRLAKDITTGKTSFTSELIQNADDNEYEDGTEPTIKFVFKSNYLIIQNNEKGFTEDNVLKLC